MFKIKNFLTRSVVFLMLVFSAAGSTVMSLSLCYLEAPSFFRADPKTIFFDVALDARIHLESEKEAFLMVMGYSIDDEISLFGRYSIGDGFSLGGSYKYYEFGSSVTVIAGGDIGLFSVSEDELSFLCSADTTLFWSMTRYIGLATSLKLAFGRADESTAIPLTFMLALGVEDTWLRWSRSVDLLGDGFTAVDTLSLVLKLSLYTF